MAKTKEQPKPEPAKEPELARGAKADAIRAAIAAMRAEGDTVCRPKDIVARVLAMAGIVATTTEVSGPRGKAGLPPLRGTSSNGTTHSKGEPSREDIRAFVQRVKDANSSLESVGAALALLKKVAGEGRSVADIEPLITAVEEMRKLLA